MHADDVVARSIVIPGPSEYLMADFLLVDFGGVFFKDPVGEVKQKVPQPGRTAQVAAACHPFYPRFARIRDRDALRQPGPLALLPAIIDPFVYPFCLPLT